ncbi:MAG TPA: Hsp70 family protein [Pyrinomonadaceae bacterium]|nr:Hsp70 family protein [Pyrinomonadaceae bacterium]
MTNEPVIGLDFGTTNSAIAVAGNDREAMLATFAGGLAAFRSILYFPARERGVQQNTETKAGPEAITSYLDADTKGRLIVSIKSYLASSLFTSTSINGRHYTLEDLIAIILRRLRVIAMDQFETSASRVVLGRPVRFAGAETEADEALALKRLQAAAELAGFKEVSFEFEPVAAAYQYETQLDHDELVLIGDFGGGTSDFTLAQLGPGRKKDGRNPVIGTSGVAIAGDTFDSRIMMRLVAPKLGLGSNYVSLGKELPVPVWVYTQLSSWHHMFLLKEPKTMGVLRQVKNQATEPQKVGALIQIITENLGYALYRAVEQTKVGLTDKEIASFVFSQSTVQMDDTLERWLFESWIQDDIQNIAACIRGLLEQCNVKYSDIGSVFLTGGSSFVPVVRRFFSRTFGADKLKSGEELTTVAKGLALRALEQS